MQSGQSIRVADEILYQRFVCFFPLNCAGSFVLEKIGKHEALLEGRLYNEEGTLCARAKANFVIFSPAVAKRLGVAREEHLQWFEEIYNF